MELLMRKTPPDSYTRQRSEVNESFLRSARDGNLQLVLEHLDYASVDVNTCNSNGLTALHLACKAGHVDVARELLQRGAVVDALTKKGNSSLHVAALAGQKNIVELLVKHGARVNIQSPVGFTPLYMAAQENHAEVVKFLLDNGADQKLTTRDGSTPMGVAVQQGHQTVVTVLMDSSEEQQRRSRLPALHVAAKRDDVRAASLLLQPHLPAAQRSAKALNSINQVTKSGFTALHMAAHYGSLNVAELLAKCGADVNAKAQSGVTPLHVASKWGRSDVVSLLVDFDADKECQTQDLLTPLHCSARNGQDSVVNVLLRRGASPAAKTKSGLTALHVAIQGDHVESSRLLLDAGADINDVTGDYLTALHVAAHCGNVRVAELLLKYQCAVEPRALNGFTPLHVACKKNRIRIIELLLQYRANVECTTEAGLTPLHVSSYLGHLTVVEYLLERGAKTETRTVREETALYVAARARQTDVIRTLLRHGAHVDAEAKDHQTPLHVSSRLNDVDTARVLLEHSARCDAVTLDLYTPLHAAVKEGHDEMVSLLLQHGASVDLITKKGFSALHIAAKYGHVTTVQLLVSCKSADGRSRCSVDAPGNNALTALHVATHYSNADVALVLLQNDASPHAVAKNGYTPLHIAAKMNRLDVAKVLLRHGAKTDAESKNGYTPLHVAAQEGHQDMVALLLSAAADVRCRARNGLTAMHLAAQEDHVPVAEILVSHDASIDPQTKAGYTPLHTACHFGQSNMVEFLLKHSSDVNAKTSADYTALHVSAQQGHSQLVDLLLQSGASPDVLTRDGQSALSIAQHLGFQPVVEQLSRVTRVDVPTAAIDYKYSVVFPETMHELVMDSDEEGADELFMRTPRSGRHTMPPDGDEQLSNAGTSPSSTLYRSGRTQEDLFAFEDQSGRQSTVSWTDSAYGRDYITDEMRYMRGAGDGITTPSAADAGEFRPSWNDDDHRESTACNTADVMDDAMTPGLFTPGGEEVDVRRLLRMDSRPLADEGMTPVGTLDRDDSTSHPLTAVQPRRKDFARINSRLVTRAVSEDLMDEEADEAVFTSRQYSTMSQVVESRRTFVSSLYSESSTGSGLLSDKSVRSPIYSGFLVSFLVDARGAVLTGRRHAGLRLVIPPKSVAQPTRVICKLVNPQKLGCPPPLAEGEALAARVLDLGESEVKFNGPILLEVPHFASLNDKHREVCVLRSDNGLSWTEHRIPASDENINKVTETHFSDLEPAEQLFDAQVARIVCTELPRYFALVTRVRVESKSLGPAGGLLSSTVAPQAQVVFPKDAIIKSIRVGLQVLPVSADKVQKVLREENLLEAGAKVSAAPVVSIEPRPRKFHQPITVTVPLPPESSLRGLSAAAARERGGGSTLRLLCSMSGALDATKWEDITGSSPLKLTDNCVSFTTTFSARFWLIECFNVDDVAHLAGRLFEELIQVPFRARCVVYAKRPKPTDARVRLLCVTDDRAEKSLEKFQKYTQVARSDIVQLLNGKVLNVDVPGMTPVVKDNERLQLTFSALRENRLHVTSKIRRRDAAARLVVTMPTAAATTTVCQLEFALPPAEEAAAAAEEELAGEPSDEWTTAEKVKAGVRESMRAAGLRGQDLVEEEVDVRVVSKAELRLTQIAEMLEEDWKELAKELGVTPEQILRIRTDFTYPGEQALVMLQDWSSRSSGSAAPGNELQAALRRIGRDDIITQCISSVQPVVDTTERDEALAFFDRELSKDADSERSRDDGDSVKLKAEYAISAETQPEQREVRTVVEPVEHAVLQAGQKRASRSSSKSSDEARRPDPGQSPSPAAATAAAAAAVELTDEPVIQAAESSSRRDAVEVAFRQISREVVLEQKRRSSTSSESSDEVESRRIDTEESAAAAAADAEQEAVDVVQEEIVVAKVSTSRRHQEERAAENQSPEPNDDKEQSTVECEVAPLPAAAEKDSTSSSETSPSDDEAVAAANSDIDRDECLETLEQQQQQVGGGRLRRSLELDSLLCETSDQQFTADDAEYRPRESSLKDVIDEEQVVVERELDNKSSSESDAESPNERAEMQEREEAAAVDEPTGSSVTFTVTTNTVDGGSETHRSDSVEEHETTVGGDWMEETLPDGSIMRRRVVTTTRHSVKRLGTMDADVTASSGGDDGGREEQLGEQDGSVSTVEVEIGRDVIDTEWQMTSRTRTVKDQQTDYSENVTYDIQTYTTTTNTNVASTVEEEGPNTHSGSANDLTTNAERSAAVRDSSSSSSSDESNANETQTVMVKKQIRRQQVVDESGQVSFVVTTDVTMTSQSDDVTDDVVSDTLQRVVEQGIVDSDEQ